MTDCGSRRRITQCSRARLVDDDRRVGVTRDVFPQKIVLGTIRRKEPSCERFDAESSEEVGIVDGGKPESHSATVLQGETRSEMTECQGRVRSASRAMYAPKARDGFFEA